MCLDDIIDDNLPKGSSNKDLEKKSRITFQQLLSSEMFEIRSEIEADMGTDFVIELKRRNHYTNFRFAVQLKATKSTLPNEDGSYSFPVEVNNINYLLNFNGPAFYVLYEANTEKFYVENVHNVFENLDNNYKDRERPEKFTIRFSKQLDKTKIQEIYDQNLLRGKTLRDTNYLLDASRLNGQATSRIIIDENEVVYSAVNIINKVVTNGMNLLNEYQYDEIIRLKGLVNSDQVENATFHLICGTAHYRKAEMQQAAVSLKKAKNQAAQLNQDLKDLLLYTHEATKYALGITNYEEFNDNLKEIGESGYISLFHAIESRFRELYDGHGLTTDRIEKFYDQMNQIADHPKADSNIVLLARAQIIAMEADVLNSSLIKNISAYKMMPFTKSTELQELQSLIDRFGERAESLRNSALEEQNDFAYNVISINIIRAHYSNSYTFHYMMNFDEDKLAINTSIRDEDFQMVENHCKLLDLIIKKYRNYSSNENIVTALSLQYELFHYSGQMEKAHETSKTMLELIETYDLKEFERKYKILINGGTRHERFLEMLVNSFSKKDELKTEMDSILEEMKSIDKTEEQGKTISKNHFKIHLLPIGIFSYPKTDFEIVMNILNAAPSVREQFQDMSMSCIPIVNILYNPIEREGPNGGNIGIGINGYRNALRIRKLFNEHGYLRIPVHH